MYKFRFVTTIHNDSGFSLLWHFKAMNFQNVLYRTCNIYMKDFYKCANIRLSEKFLSFYEEIMDTQRFLFYIILSNYVRSILFCWDKHRDISLAFTFVWRCIVLKRHIFKGRHFPDNLILSWAIACTLTIPYCYGIIIKCRQFNKKKTKVGEGKLWKLGFLEYFEMMW